MNILFLTESDISPLMGGTERITETVAAELTRRGHRCFLAYELPTDLPRSARFAAKLHYSPGCEREQFREFIGGCRVDVVISNLVKIEWKYRLLPMLKDLSRSMGFRIVACFHALAGEEIEGTNPLNAAWRLFNGGSIGEFLRETALYITPKPLTKAIFKGKLERRYRVLYDNADKVILHTMSLFPGFEYYCGSVDRGRFYDIPSALSFDHFADAAELRAKEKMVLLLARMDERSKRISLALKIWQMVERSPQGEGWSLHIVGGGKDLEWFRGIARRLGLRRCIFEGRQEDALAWYHRASLFMMTSAYEAWGLTLTEAQQCGAVPFAFDTYASLHDIIESGVSGFIIPEGDVEGYAAALKDIMADDERRLEVAAGGITSCRRFTAERVGERWERFLESLINGDDSGAEKGLQTRDADTAPNASPDASSEADTAPNAGTASDVGAARDADTALDTDAARDAAPGAPDPDIS